MSDPPTARQPIPLSLTLRFDESVKSATFELSACSNTPWEGKLGEAIIGAFHHMGQARFASVSVEEPTPKPREAASDPSTVTAEIRLTHKSFTPRTRTGSDDNYLAQLDIQLETVLTGGDGQPTTPMPLVYSEQVKIWTPQFAGNVCATGQLDDKMRTATEHLAGQFAGFVAEWYKLNRGQTTASRQSPGAATGSGIALVTMRATLLDENNNLILEPGEKIGLRVDVTNTSAGPIGPSSLTISGTTGLIDAFAESLATPARIPGLQAGETKSTILWGTLPGYLDSSRGELAVTVSPAGGEGEPATQTLVAAIQSPSASATSASPRTQSSSIPRPSERLRDRFAVIVGVTQYRTPWAGWRDGLSTNTKETVSLFADALGVPEDHTLLLQDELAARADVEEALTSWLPKHLTKDALVFFYFGGQTTVDSKTGDVFLIPYDGTPSSSPYRLVSLRFLQARLQKLGAKLAVAVIDAPSIPGSPKAAKGAPLPNWAGDLDGSLSHGTIVQLARAARPQGSNQSLLNGLTGSADLDHDGTVTLGEWLRSLRGTAIAVPTLPPALSVQSIPLSHVNHR